MSDFREFVILTDNTVKQHNSNVTCIVASLLKSLIVLAVQGALQVLMFLLVLFHQAKMKSLRDDWRNLFNHQKQVAHTVITHPLIF